MPKTRLGISVGLLGSAVFFSCFFSGYVAAILLAGYVLLFEENPWLRRSAVKGVALMFGIALVSALVSLLPNLISFINSVLNLFEADSLQLLFIGKIVSIINSAMTVIEKVLFIVLGIKALNQGTIRIPVIDSLVSKYMN